MVLSVSKDRDPDGSRLRATLQAQFAAERARGRRELIVYLLAATSVPLAIASISPAGISRDFRTFALTGWALCLLCLLVAAAAEFNLHRRRQHYLATAQPDPIAGSRTHLDASSRARPR